MSTHLSGRPRLNTILLPRPSIGAPMEAEWVDESITKVRRGGIVRVVEARKRGRLRFGWTYCDPDLAAVLLVELQQPTVTLIPRTRAAGDPEWATEVSLEVRVTSELPSLQQLTSRRVPFVVEVETLATFDRIPGTVEYGGYTLVSEDDDSATLEGTPAGTVTEGDPVEVPFMGEVFEITPLLLGTDAIAETRTLELPGGDLDTATILTYDP